MKRLALFSIALFAVACAPMSAAYRLSPDPAIRLSGPAVHVRMLEDKRPEEERTGAGAGLFNKSTKDSLYDEPVATSITMALIDELRARGVNARLSDGTAASYEVSGNLNAYRAMIIPPRTAFIPYISYVTWLWTSDRISAGIDIELTLKDSSGAVRYVRPYQLSQNTEEWVGVAGLASTGRRLDREMLTKVLRAGLKDVLGRAADDVSSTIR